MKQMLSFMRTRYEMVLSYFISERQRHQLLPLVIKTVHQTTELHMP